ncbi:hypothetical protein [Rhizobium jaguaris]|uniref:Uncharacterized protein n=1 Tax=Rhizobium jaguaris TaxID=1312183 RepID=A0A387FYN2_9HYPH|nr:hypothetical protein CCGE525_36055 [Rhizobium jaguaris]
MSANAVRELNLNPDDRRLALTLKPAQQLMGAPRHLGPHLGGFVLTHDRRNVQEKAQGRSGQIANRLVQSGLVILDELGYGTGFRLCRVDRRQLSLALR